MSLGRLYKLNLPPIPTDPAQPGATPPAGQTELMFSGTRIPRETLRAMNLADNIVKEAEAAAAQLREHGQATVEAQKRLGYSHGFAQGHARAFVAVLGTMEIERRLRELLSHRLADIVEHCLRSLLGDMGESQLMRQRITHLLASAGASAGAGTPAAAPGAPAAPAGSVPAPLGSATLYVGPEQFTLAQRIVAEFSHGAPGHIAGLNVVLDERRAPDALLLETKVCFIDSNLTLTLQEMRSMVQYALAHALQVMGEPA